MERTFWKKRIKNLLNKRTILWMAGVRRVGKTTLCQSIENATYLDCELPRVRHRLDDPELFFRRHGSGQIILDEVHRLSDPSQVLKIAADHFPHIKVIATGSSTLAARRKFRDTLTGRKNVLWLLPATLADLHDFKITDIDKRLLYGGMPQLLLGKGLNNDDYTEWIDSFWAKDLQELFSIEKKSAFLRFMELLFLQSGELFEATRFAADCEVSRQTIINYLQILDTTLTMVIIRPYFRVSAAEIKSQPKVYGFDTGFVAYFREWESINNENRGHLLEHLVLNELLAYYPRQSIYYWRDKQRHEVDFIVKPKRSREILAIECKVNPKKFDPAGMRAMRGRHPHGKNLVVCLDLLEAYPYQYGDLEILFMPYTQLDITLMAL
ncbi:MAG: ATP-binding protein [Deltaproteobacteria bacterium]|nr:ATP-binding protein [Deltaproteobacteria bacterium]